MVLEFHQYNLEYRRHKEAVKMSIFINFVRQNCKKKQFYSILHDIEFFNSMHGGCSNMDCKCHMKAWTSKTLAINIENPVKYLLEL